MKDFIKISAKTVEDAITEASIQLETSSENIIYEVVQRGTSGFLGIGSKPAIINARKKTKNDLEWEKTFNKKEEEKPKTSEKNILKSSSDKSKKQEKSDKKMKPEQNEKKEIEKEKKETMKKEPVKREPVNKEEVTKKVTDFLKDTCEAMGIKVEVEVSFNEEDNLNVNLSGDEMGLLIGKRGQTLDSLQYLTSLVANKGNGAYVRVKLDTENYRVRRKETLENLAKNIASKVKRTRKTVFLEPMNPYERRIIHSTLQNNPYVSTHSEGEEPYRKVVVTLKK